MFGFSTLITTSHQLPANKSEHTDKHTKVPLSDIDYIK
jgi:hypothetical protein